MGQTLVSMEYLLDVFPDAFIEHKEFTGHPWSGRDAHGYGKKIPVAYRAWFNNYWHRVYVICYSNCGTTYVISKHHPMLVIRDHEFPTP